MDKKAKRRILVLLVAILILVLVFLFSGLQILESTVFRKGTGTSQVSDRKTIIRDGVEYYPRQDITVILLAGIGVWEKVLKKKVSAIQLILFAAAVGLLVFGI